MRSWLRAHRKPVVISVIVCTILAVISALGYKASFFLNDDVVVEMNGQDFLSVERNSSFVLNYSFSTRASKVCTELCDWRLVDARFPRVIANGSMTAKPGKMYVVLLNRSIVDSGEGVVPYDFQLVCENRPTLACQTLGTKAYASSLTLVSYRLGQEEKDAKATVELYAPSLYQRANFVMEKSALIEQRSSVLSSRGIDDLSSSSDEIEELVLTVFSINESARISKDFWSVKDYRSSALSVRVMNKSLSAIEPVVELLDDEIDAVVSGYDSGLVGLFSLVSARDGMEESAIFYELLNLSGSSAWRNLIFRVDNLVNDSPSNVSQFIARVSQFSSQYEALSSLLEKDEQDYADEIAARLLVYDVETALLNGSEPDVSLFSDLNLNETCSLLPLTKDLSLSGDRLLLRQKALWIANNTLNVSSAIRVLQYFDEVPSNVSFNSSQITLPLFDHDLVIASRVCARSADLEQISLPPLISSLPPPVILPIQTVLESHSPICCAFGNCSSCNDAAKMAEPVIFLHGHSFVEGTTPLSSLNNFGDMQYEFFNAGYLDAGVVLSSQPSSSDSSFAPSWSVFPSPVSVRASYYYVYPVNVGELVIRKDEGIENYALRLKQIVDIVRSKTGSSKVDIVAHSMGGLVAREYLALFGEDFVDDLVLIGTPNRGISGKISAVCSLTGNARECRDMNEDSPLLKNLNAVRLTRVQVTTIRSEGCDMDGKLGDGIVLGSSVPLDYANNFIVPGNCTDALKSDLHGRLLDTKEFPNVLNLTLGALD